MQLLTKVLSFVALTGFLQSSNVFAQDSFSDFQDAFNSLKKTAESEPLRLCGNLFPNKSSQIFKLCLELLMSNPESKSIFQNSTSKDSNDEKVNPVINDTLFKPENQTNDANSNELENARALFLKKMEVLQKAKGAYKNCTKMTNAARMNVTNATEEFNNATKELTFAADAVKRAIMVYDRASLDVSTAEKNYEKTVQEYSDGEQESVTLNFTAKSLCYKGTKLLLEKSIIKSNTDANDFYCKCVRVLKSNENLQKLFMGLLRVSKSMEFYDGISLMPEEKNEDVNEKKSMANDTNEIFERAQENYRNASIALASANNDLNEAKARFDAASLNLEKQNKMLTHCSKCNKNTLEAYNKAMDEFQEAELKYSQLVTKSNDDSTTKTETSGSVSAKRARLLRQKS